MPPCPNCGTRMRGADTETICVNVIRYPWCDSMTLQSNTKSNSYSSDHSLLEGFGVRYKERHWKPAHYLGYIRPGQVLIVSSVILST